MIFLKACPKCNGDIILDSDIYGRYAKCLQCGSIRDIFDKYERVRHNPQSAEELEAA